jgi:hypothetical protein
MAYRTEGDDRLYFATMILVTSITLANLALSYYAIQTIFMFFFDYPIGVAFYPVYPTVIVLLMLPVYFFMRRPSPRRVVFAGALLGLTSAVFIHDAFNVFLPSLWVGEIPASILVMLATACVVPMAVTLAELRRQNLITRGW